MRARRDAQVVSPKWLADVARLISRPTNSTASNPLPSRAVCHSSRPLALAHCSRSWSNGVEGYPACPRRTSWRSERQRMAPRRALGAAASLAGGADPGLSFASSDRRPVPACLDAGDVPPDVLGGSVVRAAGLEGGPAAGGPLLPLYPLSIPRRSRDGEPAASSPGFVAASFPSSAAQAAARRPLRAGRTPAACNTCSGSSCTCTRACSGRPR